MTMRDTELTVEPVECMPKVKEQGKLYISERFQLAIHLCACGTCGWETVTPLGPGEWTLTMEGDKATLMPSIGNWQFPCGSHYYVRGGKVEWLD
jgi:hypothetical protein